MPLVKRARIEVYLPADAVQLRAALEREFIAVFGGCTVINGISGHYLSIDRRPERDAIDLIYADTPFDFLDNFDALSEYTDQLRSVAATITEEESILIVVQEIHHSL